ncbi:unnamed protein product [Heterobilharzia americana]|nr:unnamed protein product [Heterobilharzia americana]
MSLEKCEPQKQNWNKSKHIVTVWWIFRVPEFTRRENETVILLEKLSLKIKNVLSAHEIDYYHSRKVDGGKRLLNELA